MQKHICKVKNDKNPLKVFAKTLNSFDSYQNTSLGWR